MSRRLAVDVSHTLASPQYSGIQRYVRHVVRHLSVLAAGTDGWAEFHALQAQPGGRWRSITALPAHPMEERGPVQLRPHAVEDFQFDSGTHVLLADRFWHTEAWPALDALLASGASITLVIYDLLSLQQPQWFPPGVGARFRRYLEAVIPHASAIVCLTQAVRRQVLAWCAGQCLHHQPWVHVIPPGLDVWPDEEGRVPSGIPEAWRTGACRFVMQVGTLEPRKNHFLTLQAMEALWEAGHAEDFLLVGQQGWLTEGLCSILQQHPRVTWLPECSDPELQWCYRHAAAVVFPSGAEGYGLPLGEASALGTPVVASDTEVHREVLEGGADQGRCLFSAPHASALALWLQQALQLPQQSPMAFRAVRTWQEAALALRMLMATCSPKH